MSYLKQIDEDHIVTFKDEAAYHSCRLDYLNQYGENSNLSFSFFVEQTFRNLHPESIENIHHVDHEDLTNNPVIPIDIWEPMTHTSYTINYVDGGIIESPIINPPVFSNYNVDWAEENSGGWWTAAVADGQTITPIGDATNYIGYAVDNPCGEDPIEVRLEDKKKKPIEKISRFKLMDLEE